MVAPEGKGTSAGKSMTFRTSGGRAAKPSPKNLQEEFF
jgi:hypothetical protein